MKEHRKPLILCRSIAVLILTMILVSGMLISCGQNSNTESGLSEETGLSTDSAETSVEETEVSSRDINSVYAVIEIENTWETGNQTSATETVTIYNNSDEEITDWILYLTFSATPALSELWNGLFTVEENTLIITAESYNEEIPAHTSITLGYNITMDDIEPVSYSIMSGSTLIGGSDFDTELSSDETDTDVGSSTQNDKEDSPYAAHGKLSVTSSGIVDEQGGTFQLKGVSTHGITWFPEYINKDTFEYLKEDWGANVIRLAMYTDTGDSCGYCSGGDKEEIEDLIDTGVSAATDLGMYVIIDWHILNDGNPNTYMEDAKAFFENVSEKYADYGNVIYEIANEPNGGTTWAEVKSYAEEIIGVIRANAPDAVIIVGTPTWCQDIDIAAADPISDAENIIYSVHFYASTHKEDLRNKVQSAIDSGIPVIISEFGLCDASGSGSIDYDQSDAWFDLIEEYNLSYIGWNLSNKVETSSLIDSSCSKISGFSEDELSDSGRYLKGKME